MNNCTCALILSVKDFFTIGLSVIAIVVSIATFVFQIKLNSRNFTLHDKYILLYENFPKAIGELLRMNSVNVEHIEPVKDMINEEVKPSFSFLRFRNTKKHNEIKAILSSIEEYVCKLIEGTDNQETRNNLEKKMIEFYKTLDKYLFFKR